LDKNCASIYSSQDRPKIELLKNLLAANQIDVVLLNKQDSAYLAFGDIDLFVKREDMVKSRFLIESTNE